MRRIYLDNASTTPVDEKVVRAMKPYFSRVFGNAGSIHLEGTTARRAIEDARKKIANILHAAPDEIIFNSGTTEANNLAIFGTTEMIGHRVTYHSIFCGLDSTCHQKNYAKKFIFAYSHE